MSGRTRNGFAWICVWLLAATHASADLVYTTYSGSQNGVTIRDASTLEQIFFFDPGFPINGIAAGSGNELYLTSANSIYRYTNTGVLLSSFTWPSETITYTSTTLGAGSLYTAYQGSEIGVTVRDQITLVQSIPILTAPNNGVGSDLEDSFYRVGGNQIQRVQNDGTVLATLDFSDPGVNYTSVDVGNGVIFASYNGSQRGVTVRDKTTLTQLRFWDPGFDTNGLAAGGSDDVYLTFGNSIYRYASLGNQISVMTFADDPGVVYGDIAYAPDAQDPTPAGRATILTARPAEGSSDTQIALLIVGGEQNGAIPKIELLEASVCQDGQLVGGGTTFDVLDVGGSLDENGEALVLDVVAGAQPDTYLAARLVSADEQVAGPVSSCVVFGPNNDSWTRPVVIDLDSTNADGAKTGGAEGYIDKLGQSRWYRFDIKPGAKTTVTLSGLLDVDGNPTALPADYDVFLFGDIFQAFSELADDEDVPGLDRLGAEFAPQAFSPQAFSPQAFSPQAFSPQAFSPQAFSPQAFSPQAFSPQAFSPQAFSPQAFSPQAFSPQAFSPQAFSPQAFSPQAFSPETFASAQVRSLIAVSAKNGTAAELVLADTWNNTGSFYIRVSGKNGVANLETPFAVNVTLDAGLCNEVNGVPATPYAGASGGHETLILWDRRQMVGAGYSEAEIAPLEAKLGELAAAVAGVIVDLGDGTFPNVQALHDQAKGPNGSSCPYAANLTAQEIKKVVDAYREANPLRYIVLVGDDRQIPFFRDPDQAFLGPEQDFDPPMRDGTQSQASLRLNYVLGQDQYGSSVVTSLKQSDFPVPDLAVGRVLETPAEIMRVIDAYLATEDRDGDGIADGVVPTPTSTLVTGYDFLQDTADAVQANLQIATQGGPGTPRNRELITNASVSPDDISLTLGDGKSWTADQLRGELALDPDVIFLAGHFSANSALAADYQSTLVVTEVDASSVDMTNVIVYSSGCHSGYNIVNEEAVPGVTLQLDWPQVFARKGASLIAGTGYQYGDTDFIEYSERLYVEFTRELRRNFDPTAPDGRKPIAIGEALVRAKQRYLADTPDLIGLHRKSVLISTLFGLPMLKVEFPGTPLIEDLQPDIIPTPVPTTDPPSPGEVLGLQVAEVALGSSSDPLVLTDEVVTLDVVTDPPTDPPETVDATYLRGPSGVMTRPGAPTLPLVSRNVTAQGKSLRGVGFRGGKWFERRVVPLTGAPTTEIRGVHGYFSSLVNFPMQLASANYFGAVSGATGTILHIKPAQHRVDNIGDPDAVLRQFKSLQFELFYSSYTDSAQGEDAEGVPFRIQPALAAPPSLSGVRAVTEDVTGDGVEDDVLFFARAVGDPSAGMQKVWVTYTEGAGTPGETYDWASLDLVQDPDDSTLWSGRLPGAVSQFNRLDYIIQAVNGVGLVTLEDNYGAYFNIAGRLGEVGEDGVSNTLLPSSVELIAPAANSSGPYRGTLTAAARVTDQGGTTVPGGRVLFTLGSALRSATTDASGLASVELPLNSLPGQYALSAAFDGDTALNLLPSSDAVPFQILKAETSLELLFGAQQVNVDSVSSGVKVRLTEAYSGAVLPERTVYFTVSGGPDGDTTIPVITDKSGEAGLGDLMLPPGSYRVDVHYLGALPTGVVLEDPVYNPTTTTGTLDLIGGQNCPAKATSGKVELTGFCYLVYPVDGKVSITDGTLIVGSTTLIADGETIEVAGVIDHKIDQYGAGSVLIFESANVRGKISEWGPGGVTIYGSVGGNVFESGPGGIEVMAPAVVEGIMGESDDGDVVIGGTVQGGGDAVANLAEGFVTNATVLGNVSESGNGNLVITPVGFVDGNVFESGEGSALVDPGSVTGAVQED